jgi:hypothetical protein
MINLPKIAQTAASALCCLAQKVTIHREFMGGLVWSGPIFASKRFSLSFSKIGQTQ